MLRRCLRVQTAKPTTSTRLPHRRNATSKPPPDQPPAPQRTLLSKLTTCFRNYTPSLDSITTYLTFGLSTVLFAHIGIVYFYEFGPCDGISMLPTINSYGDGLLISKYYRRGRGIHVGDLVSYAHPINMGEKAVKRVVGMPGDFVLRDTPGARMRSEVMVQVPQGHCWVVGDNLGFSRDSRLFGPLPLALIKGKVVVQFSPWYWPHKILRNALQTPDEEDVD